MTPNSLRVLPPHQAERRAAFQRQILADIRDYLRKNGALPHSTRHGLQTLQATVSRNLTELEFGSGRASS